MKKLLLVLSVFISSNLLAGSFSCSVYTNYAKTKDLVQVTFAHEDPEEEYEEYELVVDSNIYAFVGYLPYQDGLFLSLDDKESGVSVEADFDQDSDENANITMNKNGRRYTLACSKN
ncbi:MAG: hypothetical protein GY909_06180 [Oligoflexia bacterium]|nr:hypothetical protein [Oligoflexia bacterium]